VSQLTAAPVFLPPSEAQLLADLSGWKRLSWSPLNWLRTARGDRPKWARKVREGTEGEEKPQGRGDVLDRHVAIK
jgi:hypothetical protein